MTTRAPETVEELGEIVRDSPGTVFVTESDCEGAISLRHFSGIIQHDADDQVVVVGSGMSVEALNRALAPTGQCIPYHRVWPPVETSLFEDIGLNLPHGLEAQSGTWRDWILGLTLVQADGTVCKAGSKAVKNVAGYDVQKLLIGSRGTLALAATVILRTFPVAALPSYRVVQGSAQGEVRTIQRTLATDFDLARSANADWVFADPASSTLWSAGAPARFAHDWTLEWDGTLWNLDQTDETAVRLMRRAKSLFDPEGKLHPGAMGVF